MVVGHPPLVPEVCLALADDLIGLWERTGAADPPFWSCAWPGGQALARYLLDHPEVVGGRSVVDMATGSGIVALAAAAGGARVVTAVDVDPAAGDALAANLALNPWIGAPVAFHCADVLDDPPWEIDIVCAGDVCYEGAMARRVVRWMTAAATAGATVLIGDPGRSYLPDGAILSLLARYAVAGDGVVDGGGEIETGVYRLGSSPPTASSILE
jgi:predicted nicotinamide N-methyase